MESKANHSIARLRSELGRRLLGKSRRVQIKSYLDNLQIITPIDCLTIVDADGIGLKARAT
jgi:hypothetical protein